ncbi:MAG: non-ribosomal peptide synthetase, partial [Gemmatimonadetes bacterium]|nr:non-ribosomal peptide synthetase [Gemmatimonadota bacterium]
MGKPDIEAIYPLSPLQQGMLFHALMDSTDRPYLNQLAYTLEDLDAEAFRGACRQMVERSPALRTAFVWKRGEEPLQVVHRRVEVVWEEADWRELAAGERAERMRRFLRADRTRGLDLSRAPLMRFALFRAGERSYEWVWTHHHLLFDGWSLPLVLHDLTACYRANCRGQAAPLAPRRPY